MSTSSLSSIKKNFGISDDLPIKYEKKDDELILHIPLRTTYHENKDIIKYKKEIKRLERELWHLQQRDHIRKINKLTGGF